MKNAWLALAALNLALAAGCATQPEPAAQTSEKPAEGAAQTTAANWPTDVKIHKNAKGEVECPVMKEPVASPDKADGFQDHNGTRYYFCCGMCPGKFKENPDLYAAK